MTYSNQPYGPVPQPPPKKRRAGKIVGFGCLGVVAVLALVVILAVALSGGGSDGSRDGGNAKTDTSTSESEDRPAGRSQAEEFKEFVTKNGTETEKEAVQHVTKVQGAEEQNDFLDSAEIFTDYSGGIAGPHQADGKLLASAFADWKDSANGLVTVYDKDGEILANGNF